MNNTIEGAAERLYVVYEEDGMCYGKVICVTTDVNRADYLSLVGNRWMESYEDGKEYSYE